MLRTLPNTMEEMDRSGAVNKLSLPGLRKYQVKAIQAVVIIHKGVGRFRTAARSATEIYNDILYINEEGEQEGDLQQTLERVRHLDIYGSVTGKKPGWGHQRLMTYAF